MFRTKKAEASKKSIKSLPNGRKQQLADFLNLPVEFQSKESLRLIFRLYVISGDETLLEAEAIEFLSDLLEGSRKEDGLKKKVLKKTPKMKIDWGKYRRDIVISMFHILDPDCTCTLRFDNCWDQLVKVGCGKFSLVFVEKAIEMKEEDRVFTRQLRSTKTTQEKKSLDAVAESDSDPDGDQDWQGSDESEKERTHDAVVKKQSCLSVNQVDDLRQKKVDSIAGILDIDKISAQALLDYLRWDESSLLTKYFEDKEKLLKDSGIRLPEKAEASEDEKAVRGEESLLVIENREDNNAIETCSICFEDVPLSRGTQLECRHWFCNDCWKEQIEIDVSEANIIAISCMNKDCLNLVSPDVVKKIISPEKYQRYGSFLSKNFVDHNASFKWCSTAQCESIITDFTVEGRIRVGECRQCNVAFCWDCGQEAHSPASCEALREWKRLGEKEKDALGWLLKNNVDSSTLKWIQDNTKDCPQCGTSCQKNGGCFSMSCTGCRTQWCWGCNDKWQPLHSDHFKCPKFGGRVTDKPKNKDYSKYKQRKRLQRLVNFYREVEIVEKLRTEQESAEIRDQDTAKMKLIQDEFGQSLNVQYIRDARLLVIKSYKTLQYATLMAFFLDSVAADIINFQKATFLPKIDYLRSLLEKPVTESHAGNLRLTMASIAEMREKIMNEEIFSREIKSSH